MSMQDCVPMTEREFRSTWHEVIQMYGGHEKWGRHEAYCQARKRGLGEDAAWAEMLLMIVDNLRQIVFVCDSDSSVRQ